MEDLEQVNIVRKSIIDTLKTEKSIWDEVWRKKREEIEKEVNAPTYFGLEVVDMIKTFLELDKQARALDLRIIKEMEEWISAVKKVVVGVENQESKLKQQEQMNVTLRKQVDTLKTQITKQGIVTPEFKESIKVVDEDIKEIEANRLSNEELEKGKHLFKVEKQIEKICKHLYNKSEAVMDIDRTLELSPSSTQKAIQRNPQYFEEIDMIGKKKIWTLSNEGKEYVEKIIRNKK